METISTQGFPAERQFRHHDGEEASLIRLSHESVNDTDISRIVGICNQPNVKKYVTYQYSTGENKEYIREDALAFVKSGEDSWPQNAPSYLIRDSHDIIVGTVGLKPSKLGRAEIGYWSDTEGKGGYIADAVIELCNMAEVQGLGEIYGKVALDNEKSAAVLERAGFIDSGPAESIDFNGKGLTVRIYTRKLAHEDNGD